MSSNNHREVAKLDRVPLPVEAARFGVTGWQLTRTAARILTKLPTKGPTQQKVIKQIPQTFSDLGPTYVKFGQIIASSPGAFGEELSREFRGLLDRVPPADTGQVHKLVAEELGADPAELFASFDEEPFASASIAQVHYATLRSGEEVVVKIQRPGIRRRVAADLQILKRFAQAVELAKLGRRLSAQDVVADFSDNLAEELDFRLEARSVDAWVSHMHHSPLGQNIRVASVCWSAWSRAACGTGSFMVTSTPSTSTSTRTARSCSSTSGSWAASTRAPAGCCASWSTRCWSRRTTQRPARSSC